MFHFLMPANIFNNIRMILLVSQKRRGKNNIVSMSQKQNVLDDDENSLCSHNYARTLFWFKDLEVCRLYKTRLEAKV